MAGTDFSDELLMRFVDGEIDQDLAARIETAMRENADLAGRVAVFAKTRMLAKDALDPLLNEPVPDALVSSIEAMIESRRQNEERAVDKGNIVVLRPGRHSSMPGWRWTIPLAASIVAVLAGVAGFWLGKYDGSQPHMLTFGTLDNPALLGALTTVPSGDEKKIPTLGQVRVLSSFHDRNGELCREIELHQPAGETTLSVVACRKENAWATTFAVAIPTGSDSYAPASSVDALDAYLSSIDASQPMTAAEEKQALGKLK